MAQQTSVKWLVEQLPQIDWDDPYYVGLLQEANKIFEEQIIDAATWGALAETGEQYYNEKYKK